MNLRTWARVLVAVALSISGLVETLSATGLVVELSPDGRWGSGVHTLAVSGPLQLAGAALIASGRKTRWALIILGCYVFLVSVLGNLPLIFNPDVGGSAIAGLVSNLAVIGGILYWLHSERTACPQGKACTSNGKSCTAFAGQVTPHTPAMPCR
jgi:uncharacterized membrane protein YphA (DoxX/SURF4 family)